MNITINLNTKIDPGKIENLEKIYKKLFEDLGLKPQSDDIVPTIEKFYPVLEQQDQYENSNNKFIGYKQKCQFEGLPPGIYLLSCNCPKCTTWC